MKQKIENMDIKNKRVIIRVDFNVPLKNGLILDPSKILRSLKTIDYLIDNNCSIILLSHFGKVKKESDKIANSLEPVANYMKNTLHKPLIFTPHTRGTEVEMLAKNLKPGEILLLENTRFEDVPNNLESKNDIQLAMYWASLADVFVLDAFASCHRAHASTVGLAKQLPSCLGFLVQEELNALNDYVLNPEKPFTVLMGGAKIEEKLPIVESLIPNCDYLLLSGGIANSFLKALNINIGSSIATKDEKTLKQLQTFLVTYKDKIALPLDAIVGNTYNKNYVDYKMLSEINSDDVMLDIGVKTIEKYTSIINFSNTIFMNGTVGKYEEMPFSNGTKEILRILKKSKAQVIVGGGDAVSAVRKCGYEKDFTYLSSGGGATLEYIAKKTLVAIEAVSEEETYEILDIKP